MESQKKQMGDIRRQLTELQARKQVLESLLVNYEKLAKLGSGKRDVKPKGTVSLRGAVLQVIKDSGAPIKPADIWARAQLLGAASDAKDPIAICDLMAHQLSKSRPLKKTAEGWLYTG